jgi:hypothetical protein
MECKADGDQVRREGTSALYIASQEGHLDVMRCLVEELGADANRSRHNGLTPLMAASVKGHRKVIVYLLKHGANPQASSPVNGTADVSRIVGVPVFKADCVPGCQDALLRPGAGISKCTGCKQVGIVGRRASSRTGQRTRPIASRLRKATTK